MAVQDRQTQIRRQQNSLIWLLKPQLLEGEPATTVSSLARSPLLRPGSADIDNADFSYFSFLFKRTERRQNVAQKLPNVSSVSSETVEKLCQTWPSC